VTGRQIVRLGFNERHRYRLRFRVDRNAQRVVNAPFRPFARLAVNDFDCARRFLTPD